MTDRKAFAKKVKVLCDTREQCNQHIIQYLHANGIATESRKLDFGDYSFEINGKSSNCHMRKLYQAILRTLN